MLFGALSSVTLLCMCWLPAVPGELLLMKVFGVSAIDRTASLWALAGANAAVYGLVGALIGWLTQRRGAGK